MKKEEVEDGREAQSSNRSREPQENS
ncbi:uncharacterized protein G2W53_013330 [Senna tora]|uniref:Uncharacterized protein n=1 Tax=Senna tora TaxID=362788 RepID=A0A834U0H3_9FABA|nr:uncharacterized protein G2W53_013330 [Senna tora]